MKEKMNVDDMRKLNNFIVVYQQGNREICSLNESVFESGKVLIIILEKYLSLGK